jgi:RNA polymerase sigma-70 factor, ECF subfamily
MLLSAANGQPAVALYSLDDDGLFRGRHVQVLSLSKRGISGIVAFQQPGLLEVFGLPAALDRNQNGA